MTHEHLWHVDDRGVVRCAEQGCTAEPGELQAAEVIAAADAKETRRVELDWRTRPAS